MNARFLDTRIEDSETFSRETEKDNETTWFCSTDFCLFYLYPPIKGFSKWEDTSGKTVQRCFYEETVLLGSYKLIDIYSSIPINIELISELLRIRKGRIARVRLLDQSELPGKKADDPRIIINRGSEDMIVDLPNTYEDYIKSLGPNSRRHLRHYERELYKKYEGRVERKVSKNQDISFDDFEKIIELNRIKMEKSGDPHQWNAEMTKQRYQLARKCGLLVLIKIDNKIVAGTLACLYEQSGQAYAFLTGYDIAYEKERLGLLSFLEMIKELIDLEIEKFHVLWGDTFYKKELGAKKNDLFELCIPRGTIDRILWPMMRRWDDISISREYWLYLLRNNPSKLFQVVQKNIKKG